jgi:capsular polysaccharide biosynthesis protein
MIKKTYKKIVKRLDSKVSELVQRNFAINTKYKPKGVANIKRESSSDYKYFEINPPHSSQLKLDPEFVNACSWYIKPKMRIETPGDFVLALQNGRIYCADNSNVAVVTNDGTVLEEVSFQWGDERIIEASKNKIFQIKGFKKASIYKGKVFSLLSGGGAKYYFYHWLLETIPKIYLLQQIGEFDNIDYFIVPNTALKYQREYLKHFGIRPEQIIDEEHIHHIQADWLYVTSHIKYHDHHARWVCKFLHDALIKKRHLGKRRKVYVSRADARQNRPVVNETELIASLQSLGFEVFLLGQLSIQEQAALFNSAEFVVTSHGGGLSNLTYCDPGTIVLELYPDKYVRHIFYDIADKRSLQYHYMLLPSTGDAVDAGHGQKIGLIADVDKITSKVKQLLGPNTDALRRVSG